MKYEKYTQLVYASALKRQTAFGFLLIYKINCRNNEGKVFARGIVKLKKPIPNKNFNEIWLA